MAGASALQKRTAQARPDAASFAPGGVAGFATSGDSLTAAVLPNGAPNWPIILSIITDGAFRLIFDAGIGGYTTSQVLARFLAAVRQTKPAVCTIFSGANDVTGSYSGWQANIRAIVAACRASGIQPVLCTITPNSSAGANATILKWNNWLRLYANSPDAQGRIIPLIDFSAAVIDPSTGNWKTGLVYDGLHPNGAGAVAMAQAAKVTLMAAGLVRSPAHLLPSYGLLTDANFDGIFDLDGINLVPNPLFSDTNADNVPDGGWSYSGTGTTGTTRTVMTDSRILGNVVKFAFNNPSGNTGVQCAIPSSLFAPGDRLRLGLKIAIDNPVNLDDGSHGFAPNLFFNGVGTNQFFVQNLAGGTTGIVGTLIGEMTVPAGATLGATLSLACNLPSTASGSISVGRVMLANLTAQGMS